MISCELKHISFFVRIEVASKDLRNIIIIIFRQIQLFFK